MTFEYQWFFIYQIICIINSFVIHTLAFLFFFKISFIFIFRERGREGEREGEKHQCVVAPHMPPTGDLTHNPGMCHDWESNQ